MKPIIIETHQLSYWVGNRALVKNVDWQVRQGEHWLVFGQNGSGKTTLLSLLAGYIRPTGGALRIFDQAYTAQNVLTLGRRIGWISGSFFEKYYSHEAILDIVLSGKLVTLGMDTTIDSEDVRKAKQLLKAFHLPDKASYPFSVLSNGERQGVLMARALMGSPDILMLDEPTAGLDIFARQYLLQIIQGLARESALTLIFVTHYVEEIVAGFEQGLLLKDGQVFAHGATQDVISASTLSELLHCPVTVNWQKHCPLVELQTPSPVHAWLDKGWLSSAE